MPQTGWPRWLLCFLLRVSSLHFSRPTLLGTPPLLFLMLPLVLFLSII